MDVTIVIPNYDGLNYLKHCIQSIQEDCRQETQDNQNKEDSVQVLVVDNGSTDGSVEWLQKYQPWVTLISLKHNVGFSKAVNLGIKQSKTEYVILLNNDTKVFPGFTKQLFSAINGSERIFSVSALMLQRNNPELVDHAGDLYCALGWARARGAGKRAKNYQHRKKVFSACAGAAIYRKKIMEEIGYFDERHFAYLEDVDIGWRARIFGYENWYEPNAKVLHAGSATTGSEYNPFKTRVAARNNLYTIWKNMPLWQLILNFPLLLIGFCIKLAFFFQKRMGILYLEGLIQGIRLAGSKSGKEHKIRFSKEHLRFYLGIQKELWFNLFQL